MEYGGPNIEQLLPKMGYSVEEFLGLAIDIVLGLQEIHAKHVIHGNIKLSNMVCYLCFTV